MFVVAGCSGPLPNAVPLPLARSSPPVSLSSTPSSRDSIWNGKPAPSTYLHKLLDVTSVDLALDNLSPKSTESGAIQAERQPFFSGLSSKVIYLPRWRRIVFLIACRSYHRRR